MGWEEKNNNKDMRKEEEMEKKGKDGETRGREIIVTLESMKEKVEEQLKWELEERKEA